MDNSQVEMEFDDHDGRRARERAEQEDRQMKAMLQVAKETAKHETIDRAVDKYMNEGPSVASLQHNIDQKSAKNVEAKK